MALSLTRCFGVYKRLSVSPACNTSVRSFLTSSPAFQPRRAAGNVQELEEEEDGRRTRSVLEDDMDELVEQWDETSEVEDSPSSGHIMLQELRQTLHYLRLIEHEMPKLVGAPLLYSSLRKNGALKVLKQHTENILYRQLRRHQLLYGPCTTRVKVILP